MRKILAAMFIACLVSAGLADELKIGYVDSQRIFAESREYQDAQAKFDKDVENWNAQAEQMKTEIDKMTDELESQSLMLSAEKKKEKESLLNAKQDTLNQFLNATFGPNGKAERRMAELSKPIRDRILEIIEEIAIESNYGIIFDAGTVNIAYAKKSLDLTDEVLEKMTIEK